MNKKKNLILEVEKLKSFKERSGWSCQKISIHMNMHAMTIQFWLTGRYCPSKLALEKIKEFLLEYDY